MRIACVIAATELDANPTDVIVFPEGVNASELFDASAMHPESVVIGAIEEDGYSRAVMLYNGTNHVSYLKVETDGRTRGTDDCTQVPIARFSNMCVGMLVCMDVQNPMFSLKVLKALQSCSHPLKLLCIPADMGSYWFEGSTLPFPAQYSGIYVALSNHTKTHDVRCKSFVADVHGNKICIQLNTEPIYADIT